MNLTVKYEIEQLDDVRFWLETVVDGRTVTSRGVVIQLHGTTQEMRQEARRRTSYAQMRIDNMVHDGLQPKQADAALRKIIIEEIPALNAQWDELSTQF